MSKFWSVQLPTPIFFGVDGCSLHFFWSGHSCPLQNVGVHVVKVWSAFSLTLNYFSSSDYSPKIIDLSLGLILCWYQNQGDFVLIDQKFPNEYTYWKKMVEIITSVFSDGLNFSAEFVVDPLRI
jgi:hypothetical protein